MQCAPSCLGGTVPRCLFGFGGVDSRWISTLFYCGPYRTFISFHYIQMGQASSQYSLLSFDEHVPATAVSAPPNELSSQGGAVIKMLTHALSLDVASRGFLPLFGWPRSLLAWVSSAPCDSSSVVPASGVSSVSWAGCQAVGFASIRPGKEEGFCQAVWVAPDKRGHGIGRCFISAVRELLLERDGAIVLWPVAPPEAALDFALKVLMPSEKTLAAWLVLHGNERSEVSSSDDQVDFPFYQQETKRKSFESLATPGALAAAAAAAHWDLTRLTKRFAEFLAQSCSWNEEHALAVALLVCGEVFKVSEATAADNGDARDAEAEEEPATSDSEGDGDEGGGREVEGDAEESRKRARPDE